MAAPSRVRCDRCGEHWSGLARFCGRCGDPLHTDEARQDGGHRDGEQRSRARRRLMGALVLVLATLVLVAVLTTGGDPDAPPVPDGPTDAPIQM